MHITTESIFVLDNGIREKPLRTRSIEKLTNPRVTITTENQSRALGRSLSSKEDKPRFSAITPTMTMMRASAYRRMIEPPCGLPDDTLVGAFY